MNTILNRGKLPVLAIINGPKVKLFVMNFAAKSRLDDKKHSLPNFLLLTEYKLCDISISA